MIGKLGSRIFMAWLDLADAVAGRPMYMSRWRALRNLIRDGTTD